MKITRSTSSRWIAGVLGGIAEHYIAVTTSKKMVTIGKT